jgi:hypothetical protein
VLVPLQVSVWLLVLSVLVLFLLLLRQVWLQGEGGLLWRLPKLVLQAKLLLQLWVQVLVQLPPEVSYHAGGVAVAAKTGPLFIAARAASTIIACTQSASSLNLKAKDRDLVS